MVAEEPKNWRRDLLKRLVYLLHANTHVPQRTSLYLTTNSKQVSQPTKQASKQTNKSNITIKRNYPSEANRSSVSQEAHHNLWNPRVHYRVHNSPPPVHILNQANPFHASSYHSFTIHCNIRPSVSRSSQWSLSSSFPTKWKPFPRTRDTPHMVPTKQTATSCTQNYAHLLRLHSNPVSGLLQVRP
jgi:hypothetical protein